MQASTSGKAAAALPAAADSRPRTEPPEAAASLTDPSLTVEQIASRLEDLSVPTLIAAVAHLTGDPSLLRGPLRPRTFIPNDFQGGLPDEERRELRRQALDAITVYRAAGCPPIAPPPPVSLPAWPATCASSARTRAAVATNCGLVGAIIPRIAFSCARAEVN